MLVIQLIPIFQIANHGLPPGIELVDGDNLKQWLFDIQVLDQNPIYEGQVYRLKFLFPDAYPIGAIIQPKHLT